MTATWDPIVLQRDCEALTVPYGERVALTAGGEVEITQQLGSSVTVRTQLGTLLRIDAADADALGLAPSESTVRITRQTGEFDFAEGTEGFVEISGAESTGTAVVDAIVFRRVPANPEK